MEALDTGRLALSSDMSRMAKADAIIIAVPTPVDEELNPDPRAVHGACATVVQHARAGQTIILTSTTYVGTTRTQLVEPLAERGLSPARTSTSRLRLSGSSPVTSRCRRWRPRGSWWCHPRLHRGRAPRTGPDSQAVHTVSSAEAAEATKLYENTFRAVNLAFANEMAAIAKHYDLDIVELVDAAATKPYGFLAHYPGAGIGGHCIPVDPYYLLAPLAQAGVPTPIATAAWPGSPAGQRLSPSARLT